MEPALLCVCWITPQPNHSPKCLIQVFFRDEVVQKKIWLFTRSCFHEIFLEFQSYSRHKNHFDIGLKQTYSENNSSDSY